MAEVAVRQKDTNRARERPYRSTAVIVGVLFIIATAFLFVGEAVYGSVLESDEVLEVAYPDRVTAVVGVLLEFLCVLAILLIPVFLFPLLRRQNEALALGYAGFRFLEVVLFITIEVNLLSLIGVSEDYLAAGSDSSSYEAIVNSIRSQNDWIFFMYVITFAIGALVLYTLLYQSQLVPRWLAVWGLIGGGMILVGTVLITLDALDGVRGVESELIWAAPIAVQEMVMAVWLIIKGFNTTALRMMAPDMEGAPRPS
jgi:hypothetical protein